MQDQKKRNEIYVLGGAGKYLNKTQEKKGRANKENKEIIVGYYLEEPILEE